MGDLWHAVMLVFHSKYKSKIRHLYILCLFWGLGVQVTINFNRLKPWSETDLHIITKFVEHHSTTREYIHSFSQLMHYNQNGALYVNMLHPMAPKNQTLISSVFSTIHELLPSSAQPLQVVIDATHWLVFLAL